MPIGRAIPTRTMLLATRSIKVAQTIDCVTLIGLQSLTARMVLTLTLRNAGGAAPPAMLRRIFLTQGGVAERQIVRPGAAVQTVEWVWPVGRDPDGCLGVERWRRTIGHQPP
mgnify:CR=1 FL=1